MHKALERLYKANASLPHWLKPWLRDDFFLTQELKSLTGDAQLHHIKTQWALPDWWERYVLCLNTGLIYRREIAIHSHATPCWYAKTIIPQQSYDSCSDVFSRLAQQSLGELIFSNAAIERKSCGFYPISNHCLEYFWPQQDWVQSSPVLWVKLSTFLVANAFEFYLTEIFLPGFETCLIGKADITGS